MTHAMLKVVERPAGGHHVCAPCCAGHTGQEVPDVDVSALLAGSRRPCDAPTRTSSSTTSPAPFREGVAARQEAGRRGADRHGPADLSGVEPGVGRILLVASADGVAFDQVPALCIQLYDAAVADGEPLARFRDQAGDGRGDGADLR
ncbi:hypothetical protein GCM10017687_35170 [Streptomyces echinatus]